MRALLDTDVLIRIVTGDDPVKQEAGFALFDKAEAGEVTLVSPESVISDAVYVLRSPTLYRMNQTEIQERLSGLIRAPSFEVENRETILDALEIFGSNNVDFGDAMIVATARREGIRDVYSHDRDFDRFDWVDRVEP